MSTPLLIVGDAPFRPTGLSRILTDVVRGITGELLPSPPGHDWFTGVSGFDVGVVGYAPWAGLPRTGIPLQASADGYLHHWKEWTFSDLTHHGAEAVQTAYRSWFGDRRGILLSLWDPGRCFAFTQLDLPVEKWGYFAIDAANMNGGISGPAGLAVNAYDRVLAYTAFGKRVLATATDLPIDVLPHGIDLSVFTREMKAVERAAGIARIFPAGYQEGTLLLGCVATNQPRKDLGLFIQVLRELRNRGHQIHGWLHTDRLITEAWSIPQLAADAEVADHLTVTTAMTDRELAVAYSLCFATIAPGRGEGMCYPMLESLACEIPVIAARHSAFEEYVPYHWQIVPTCLHAVGPYALMRPILDPINVATRVEELVRVEHAGPLMTRNVVQQLDWPTLWPAWAAWLQRGLDHFQETRP